VSHKQEPGWVMNLILLYKSSQENRTWWYITRNDNTKPNNACSQWYSQNRLLQYTKTFYLYSCLYINLSKWLFVPNVTKDYLIKVINLFFTLFFHFATFYLNLAAILYHSFLSSFSILLVNFVETLLFYWRSPNGC